VPQKERVHVEGFKELDAALRQASQAGYRLVDATPRIGAGGCRIAFLHPKSTAGILIELTE